MRGTTTSSASDGEIFRFAENHVVPPGSFRASRSYAGDLTGSEWAGATFGPKNGNRLFVNIMGPGITSCDHRALTEGPAVERSLVRVSGARIPGA